MNEFTPSFKRSQVLKNMYFRQINMVKKAMTKLHEDLQYDYEVELNELAY